MSFELRDAERDDLPAVHAINEEAVPAMNSLPLERFEWFHKESPHFRIATVDGETAGFLICLDHRAEYDSPNFIWFKQRCGDIFYIDRLAIGGKFRRLGIGRALYREAATNAVALGYALLACEVNLRPRNWESLNFHIACGFEAIGSQDNGQARVQYMIKRLR